MARRNVFLHIGPDKLQLTDELRAQLADAGVMTPDVGQGDLDRASLEIRRNHKSAGLKRRDVEGAWAKVGRRAFKLRADAFISQPAFFGAERDQAALSLDGLMGMRVHLVTTAAELPDAWRRLVKPQRVHVVEEDLAVEVAAIAVRERHLRAQRKLLKLVA